MRLFDYDRVTGLMTDAGIDLILASSKSNVSYLLDYYADPCNASLVLDDGSMYYQSFVGLPSDPDIASFFTPWIGEVGYMTSSNPWVQDRLVYGELLDIPGIKSNELPVSTNPIDCAVKGIKDLNLDLGTIGVEKTRMPLDSYERLSSSLPKVRFVDSTSVLSRLRAVKSDEEIERLRYATLVTEKAVRAGYDSVRVGTTEREFTRTIEVSLAEQGLGCGWVHVAFGPKGARDIMPRDTVAQVGEALRVDVGGIYDGYVCDMSRVGVLGNPTAELSIAVEAVREAYECVRAAVRPGARTGDLYSLGAKVLEERGFDLFLSSVGHGVGRDVHEWPYILANGNDYLLDGMVVTVEVEMRQEGLGCINIEDMVLVTQDGSELISTMEPGLYQI